MKKLEQILKFYRPQANYNNFKKELSLSAKLLDVSESAYRNNPLRLNSLALFIFRSLVYLKLAENGQPCFAIPTIARRLDDPRILEFYQIKYGEAADYSRFKLGCRMIAEQLGTELKNEFITPEALIVSAHGKSNLVVALGLRLIGDVDGELIYGAPA